MAKRLIPEKPKQLLVRLYRDGILESLRLHLAVVFRGWVGLIGIVSAVLAVAFGLAHKSVPFWVLFAIALASLFVAQFLAFHNEREKGSELGGALYLLEVEWAVQKTENESKVTLQPTLKFRNTSNRQIHYELLDYSLNIGKSQSEGAFNNQSGWVGAGQDAGFRLPPVRDLPFADEYEGMLSYRFSYVSPRIKRYAHRMGRRLIIQIACGPTGITALWAYDGLGEEETIRL